MLQSPKVYFYDTGLVEGDEGLRFENLVATALLKQVQWQHDVQGKEAGLHYIRTKDGAEVDFALSEKVSSPTWWSASCQTKTPSRFSTLCIGIGDRASGAVVRNASHSDILDTIQVAAAHQFLRGLIS